LQAECNIVTMGLPSSGPSDCGHQGCRDYNQAQTGVYAVPWTAMAPYSPYVLLVDVQCDSGNGDDALNTLADLFPMAVGDRLAYNSFRSFKVGFRSEQEALQAYDQAKQKANATRLDK
jgi:hypothetical protein